MIAQKVIKLEEQLICSTIGCLVSPSLSTTYVSYKLLVELIKL